MEAIKSEIGRFQLEGFLKWQGRELSFKYARIHTHFRQTLQFRKQPPWLVTGAWYQITRDWVLN